MTTTTPRTDALEEKMYLEGLPQNFRSEYLFCKCRDMERDLAAAQEAIRKQGQSALTGMDAAKAIASHNLESAKAINAQSNPAALDEARALNERLTNELEAAQEARQRAEARAEALLRHLPENWGDEVIEGEIMLRVDSDAIDAAIAEGK